MKMVVSRDWIDNAPDDTQVKVRTSRYFSAHHMMSEAAREALEGASEQSALTAIIMSAMAAEALANAVGGLILGDVWKDIEKNLSPWGKYRLICRELKIPCKGVVDWERLKRLFTLRNEIAHAKPERVESTLEMTMGEHKASWLGDITIFGASKLEKKLTKEMAREAVEAFERIWDILVAALDGGNKSVIDGDCAWIDVAPADVISPSS
ncbi:hypothetical protein [Dyella nitratireducens]|uniref:RiboL-PSP-HEPN domain-containing protein n=1 Tax=Dyella nitratireducens TaxID=1849580 RepID=A0ABQ1FK32_9GAMM|nr:hypothetical protein [Dyella nitratireducens]GGA19521.1 hypothetical protein GCM10010981_04410 [Dyella nitratireducens]GLQ44498.1 hypothetical protein GCM10007902_43480 [Dyella nitratireducens]